MAIHTDLPIYRTGVQLLDLAVSVQEQMPRSLKRIMGEKITQHCVDILELMALANASHLGCGPGPEWEINNPPPHPEEPLPKALTHAAHLRSQGYPSVLMLPGQSPRADGSIDPAYRM